VTVLAINAMIVGEGRLSGIGHYTVQLATWFAAINREIGNSYRLIVFVRAAAAHHFSGIGGVEVRVVNAGEGRVSRVLAEQVRLPRLLRREKVDAVLNPAFTGPTWGARAIVTTVHDPYFIVVPHLLPRAQQLFLSVFVPLCCRRSRHVVTTSRATLEELVARYPDLVGKVTVVPMANRLPAPLTLPVPSERGNAQPFVLLVAALTGNKNPEPLVAAVAEARKRHPGLTMVHVGSDAASWVIRRTGVSDAELAELYRQCLCVAVPSICEGFGLPLLEAQAFGAPVIASNRSALPEVGGAGAIYFDPTDPEDIAAAIDELISSPGRREALRQAGFANQAQFSWERTAREMLAIMAEPFPVSTKLQST
jgi:glycosyltransferase involved in cell wall biosynthesis